MSAAGGFSCGAAGGFSSGGEGSFAFALGTPADEPEIRALVGAVPMPGAAAIRFERQPDYFLGTTIMGEPCDVLTARHRPSGRLAGIACRAEHRAFINGQEAQLGYIGQIRVAPEFQGRWLVQRGAQALRQAGPPELLYYGVIAGENPRARRLLTGKRLPGGAQAVRVCGLTTRAILLRPQRRQLAPGVEVRPGAPGALAEIVRFLRAQGPRRQFFPAYTLEDFTGGKTLRGLRPEDIQVARRGAQVVGVMAAWDQSAYKQDVVDAYAGALRRLRPLYDLAARLLGAQPLTPPGQAIPLSFAALICVQDDDPAVMQALLAACMQHARRAGKAFLMLGLADDDPLLPAASRPLHVTYRSDLYAAAWTGDPAVRLDGRAAYIEIATL